MQTSSVNTIICCHSTHRGHLMQTQTQTLHANQAQELFSKNVSVLVLVTSYTPHVRSVIIRSIFLWLKIREQFEFFLNNTNLTFLAFSYKIDITGFQNQQKYSCLHWVLNSHHQCHLLEFQLPYPLSQSVSLKLSDPYKVMLYWTWNDPSSVHESSIQQMSLWLNG